MRHLSHTQWSEVYIFFLVCSTRGPGQYWVNPINCTSDQWCWDGVSGTVGELEEFDGDSCPNRSCGVMHKKSDDDWHWHAVCCSMTYPFACEKGWLLLRREVYCLLETGE